VQRLLAAGSAQAVDTIGTSWLNPMHYLANRTTGRTSERIAQVLHDANKDWIRAQSSDGCLPLHGACSKISTPHSSSLPCIRGSARDDCHGWLPIHYLRILREPDEEVTPEDIVTIKLLVAAWPESANIPSCPMIQMSNTVYNAAGPRLVCSATSSAYARLRALCRHTVRLNYPHRRALALLFCKIPVRDMPPLVGG
jgi:hypothetical protein